MRRQQLTEAQITALLDPPTDQRELVRHYTLTAADLAAIRRCRGDHNRLGHALMLCYLRYPGRPLKARERPPRPLLLFIADQIDALPGSIEDYLAAGRNRQRHVAELQDRLRHAIGQMNKRREPVELEVIALLDHRALLVERVPGTGIALGGLHHLGREPLGPEPLAGLAPQWIAGQRFHRKLDDAPFVRFAVQQSAAEIILVPSRHDDDVAR